MGGTWLFSGGDALSAARAIGELANSASIAPELRAVKAHVNWITNPKLFAHPTIATQYPPLIVPPSHNNPLILGFATQPNTRGFEGSSKLILATVIGMLVLIYATLARKHA
jgi:hypothetical protein